MLSRLRYDDVAWERSEAIADGWCGQFFRPEILRPVGSFLIRHHRPGDAVEFSFLERGAYNFALSMKYKNANAAIIRFPQPGATMFPEEKVRNEVAVMRYIFDQTSIPIPFIHHWGTKLESPLGLSPFIIMDYIEHDTNMYDALNKAGCPKGDRRTLDPDISEARLDTVYREVASILLQLSRPPLPRIGSLAQVDDFTWEVAHRPLSMSMNTLVQLGSLPQSKLPTRAFNTASSYFEALADLHIAHLTNQRNDAIDSTEDCWRKLVARYLFRKLARERRLTNGLASFDKGPFKLWCDDFRPANILMNEDLKIVGVVDWKFTYAAPVQFSFAPPWWFLIEKPEYWSLGLDDWCTAYKRRLQTFLNAMRYQEDRAIKNGWLETIFGPTSALIEDVWKQRLDFLEPKERADIEIVVAKKLEEMKTRELSWDPDDYTKEIAEKDSDEDATYRRESTGGGSEAKGAEGDRRE